MPEPLDPLLDVDDAGQVMLGVVGEQRPLPGAGGDVVEPSSTPAVSEAPVVPGQLGLTGASSVLGDVDLDELPDPEASWALRDTTR